MTMVICDDSNHRYEPKEAVDVWVNKVGPYANPQEAYNYYTLPYCAPETSNMEHHNKPKPHSLAEVLGGHSLRHSGHDVRFPSPSDKKTITEECTSDPLTAEQSAQFTKAADEQWFYQMYIDDLPVWGLVGEMLPDVLSQQLPGHEQGDLRAEHLHFSEDTILYPYVYTERKLILSYNGDRIINVDLTSEPASLKKVEEGIKLKFTLIIEWKQTTDEFHSRFDRYLDHSFFKHQIHWFSIFNSFMMVLFLAGLVTLIFLRTLRKDYARYATTRLSDLELAENEDNEDDHMEKKSLVNESSLMEDSGWKQVHGDVFRAPSYLPLFAALLGTGWQLIALVLGVILFALAGPLHGDVYEARGEVLHASLVCYILSSIIAGFTSGSFFKRFSAVSASAKRGNASQSWQIAMGLTVMLLPTVTTIILVLLNFISIFYGTINTIPFLAILKVFFIWSFVSIPLGILGTLLGRHFPQNRAPLPCRVNSIPRPIPHPTPWYGNPSYLIPLSGLLPFGSVFIELYYILTSIWNYKFYHVYGFILAMYAILSLVTSLTSIIATYFILNAENYHWQWNSFFSGAATSIYVFLYGLYYFLFKTGMYGLLQTSFYFGYMTLIALCVGVLCGTLGYTSSSMFVQTIYGNVKID